MEPGTTLLTKHRRKQTPTIRYEPYPTIVVKPKKIRKKQSQPSDDREEGEITEQKGDFEGLGNTDTGPPQIQQSDIQVNQITAVNELCPNFCTTGTRKS